MGILISPYSFTPIDIFLLIHGFVFPCKSKRTTCKYVTLRVMSFVIFEGNIIYNILSRAINVHHHSKGRDYYILSLTTFLEGILRILLHVNRKKINLLTKQLFRIYNTVASKNLYRLKLILFVILLVNDVTTIIMFSFYFIYILANKENNYHYGFIPPPYSTPASIISVFLCYWSFTSHFICIYFCCFCFVLKTIFQQLKKKLLEISETDFIFLHHIYSDVSKLISSFPWNAIAYFRSLAWPSVSFFFRNLF